LGTPKLPFWSFSIKMGYMDAVKWLENHRNFFSPEMNGYSNVPIGPYLSTLPLIDGNGKIIDSGCGNGMLLKFLIEFSGHSLIPFGIDLNEKAIAQASKEILSDYADNFLVEDVKTYDFNEGPFDFIITNPFYAKPKMREFTEKCLKNLKVGGRLIYRVHDDVLKRNMINDLGELPDFEGLGMKTIQGRGLIFGIFEK